MIYSMPHRRSQDEMQYGMARRDISAYKFYVRVDSMMFEMTLSQWRVAAYLRYHRKSLYVDDPPLGGTMPHQASIDTQERAVISCIQLIFLDKYSKW